MSNIHNYPLTATQINDEDFFDVDFWTGSTYETRKISGATLKTILGNIYNADGSIPATTTRIVSIPSDSTIDFNDGVNSLMKIFGLGAVQVGANDGTIGAFQLDWNNDRIVGIKTGTTDEGRLSFSAITTSQNWSLPDQSGTIALTNDLTSAKNISSSQWSKTLPSTESLANGAIANGFTFFLETDKVTGGTTSYDEYFLFYGISLLFTGTSGSGTIVINSVGYGITFATDLPTTINNFITANSAAIEADADVRIFQVGDNMRFCGPESTLNAILYTQNSADLSATLQNEFTQGSVSSPDHLVIPYVGKPYENKRIHHTFRVNFNIVAGSDQTLALSLRRYEDDSIIGSEIQVFRNQDVEGVQQTFASYTASASDPFVVGGFYFALRNDSGIAVEISGGVGILIQNEFENPTSF